jgi:L-fucose isomerase-like protein
MLRVVDATVGMKDDRSTKELSQAGRIYVALKQLATKYDLCGFTIGCFDLIADIDGTPCVALSLLNEDGIVVSCEGELDSFLGMAITANFLESPSFMANLADYDDNSILFAHCTAPLGIGDVVIRSHFESGTGLGLEVHMPADRPATVFKIRGRQALVAQGHVREWQNAENRCRTQLVMEIDGARQFVDAALGNHHLIVYEDAKGVAELLEALGFDVGLFQG